ncbi:hypothetical protein F511_33578 [Dorcoceras hygrometricum]|uniref:Uncharacterized protein n=1 Tax=Dorcoceras hygrometricum TaxID=472368 RepID=A0A2Z7BH24_9LAMI|nr:hypothetical protein F511_33578 [Dorcoceras hygrometricum]
MGIDQLKLHSVQPGYLKNLPRPTQTKAAPNRENKRGTTTQSTITRQCGIQAQRLSWPPHQNNVGPFRHDDSAGRSQRVKEFSFQRNQAQYILQQEGRSNQLKSTAQTAPRQLSRSYYKLESIKISQDQLNSELKQLSF